MKYVDRILTAVVSSALAIACTGTPGVPVDEHAEYDEHETGERPSLTEEAYATAGIRVAPAERRVLRPAVRVTGTLSYDERKMAIATARIGGRVTEVAADFGQSVSIGAILAWIDSPDLAAAEADYLRAVSLLRLREAEYERARLLLEGQAISRGELLRREADLRATEADVRTAQQKLHILGLSREDVEALPETGSEGPHVYPVRASVAGQVTERTAVAGRVVDPHDELFTIASLDSLWLFLQVFEKDLPAIATGASVTLTCESHPDDRFRGTIDFVGQVLDPHSRTVRARAVIDNPEGELRPGMFVYATIEARPDVGAAGRPRLAVPVEAITEIEGSTVVFVEVGERSFEPRQVELGQAAGEWVEVVAGLAEGQLIAVSGVFTLKSEVQKGGLVGHDH